MLKIVLTGIFYPLAMLRYFERALRRRDDVELITAGIYTGNWIPWWGGIVLLQKYAIAPSMILTAGRNIVSSIPASVAETRLPPGFVPDMWLQIDAGFHLTGNVRNGVNVIVGTDPHVLNYDRQRRVADKFYSMQQYYAKPGDGWLPYAYDPEWHRPEDPPDGATRYDACLLGLHYKTRDWWVNALRQLGVSVDYDLGPVGEEARARYAAATIGLNWSSLKDLNARFFELPAVGKIQVCNVVPNLNDFLTPDRDVLTFKTREEAVEKVMWALSNPEAAQVIAKEGRKTIAPHSWDARIDQIIEECL